VEVWVANPHLILTEHDAMVPAEVELLHWDGESVPFQAQCGWLPCRL